MASNYWTLGRIRLARLQAAFVRMNDIVRDLVDVKLSVKLGYAEPSIETLWNQWCYDHHDVVSKYRFWRKQPKETHIDKEIPILQDVDVTFFVYLMREIDPTCEEIKAFQQIRNKVAHMTKTEFEDEDEYEDQFQEIIDAVNKAFESNAEMKRKWRNVLRQIQKEEIGKLEEHLPEYEKQAEEVRTQTRIDVKINTGGDDANNMFKVNNVVSGDNINVHTTNISNYFVVPETSISG